MVKRITQCRPIAVRIGRLRLRLEDDVREDMGSMKFQNCSKMDIDRDAWKRTVEQAKTHRVVTSKCPDQPSQPLIQWVQGIFPKEARVKQPAHEVNHSFSSRAKLKNEYSYTPIPCMPSWHKQGKPNCTY
jgi:hypothetical protein